MERAGSSIDQTLLIASGVAAALIVALINFVGNPLWPAVMVYTAFIGLFLCAANYELLGWSERRRQAALLLMALLSAVALVLHPDTATLILSVVLMASVPYHFTPRGSWCLLLLANICYVTVLELRWNSTFYLFSWASLIALQAFAITSSLSRRREMAQQELLAQQNEELIAARALLDQKSKTEERLRIAGDLHDSIGHQLTALRLQLEALAHEAPGELLGSVRDCQQLSADLLEQIRSIVRRMSEDQEHNLAAAIDQMGNITPGVSVTRDTTLPSLAPEPARQLTLCIQEAISNAVRHGNADAIHVRFNNNTLYVEDNGCGLTADSASPGFGLNNICHRLETYQGSAELSTSPSGGCLLALSLGTALSWQDSDDADQAPSA
ncbi:MAG: histidine kinase [Pseudomonadota bacterium]